MPFIWLLVLVPLLIHLINLRVRRRLVFSSLAVLRQVASKQGTLSRLKRYAVLFCRTGLAVILVFFLWHFFTKEQTASTRVRIIIDNSYSTSAQLASRNLLETFKLKAVSIIKSASEATKFDIITSNGSHIERANEAVALQFISTIQVALQPKVSILPLLRRDSLAVTYLLTDGQLADTSYYLAAIKAARSTRKIFELYPATPTDPILGIDTAFKSYSTTSDGQGIFLTTRATNSTAAKAEATINQKPFATVPFSPNGIAKIDLPPTSPDQAFDGTVAIKSASNLRYSNIFYLASSSITTKVFIAPTVANPYLRSYFSGSAYALVSKPSAADLVVAEGATAIAGLNLSALSSKTVLISPSFGDSPAQYSAALATVFSANQITQVPNGMTTSPSKLDNSIIRSAFLGSAFASKNLDNLELPYFQPIVVPVAASFETLISTEDNQPVLLRKTETSNQIYAFTGRLSPPASNLQLSYIFPAILYNIARQNSTFSSKSPDALYSEPSSIQLDSLSKGRYFSADKKTWSNWSPAAGVSLPGIYALVTSPDSTTRHFAINLPKTERTWQQAPPSFTDDLSKVAENASSTNQILTAGMANIDQTDFRSYLVALALLFIFVELILLAIKI